MPRISVIIPTYNSAQYLGNTLRSVLEQDFQDYEIIVIDDASTDNTAQIVNALNSNKINYIRLSENHGGPSRPRNIGIKNARSEYIAIFDSDDLMLPGRIESAVSKLDLFPQVGMVFTNAIKFDDKNGDYAHDLLKYYDRFNSLKTRRHDNDFYIIGSKKAFDCLFFENFIQTSSVTIRRAIFDKIGLFDESLNNADDWDMWFRISRCYSLGYLNRICVKYRIRDGSISKRAAKLGNNQIKVIRKNLDSDLEDNVRDQARNLISIIYAGMGYSYRCANQMVLARKNYILSLKEKFNWVVFLQWLITFLGYDTINVLRKIKQRITAQRS